MTTEFSVGQHVGDYEILSILGAGGMGKVYKVRNVISDRAEAMKILLPDLTSNQGLADRFLREIRLLATLNHPNIAALRTALKYENQLVMIIEFVEGETLANRLARAPLSTAEVVNYASQALSALSYAHKLNIIHRDIKPANMMLTPQGVVKLMDFGIARSATDGSLTTTGTTLGSLNYMPPEQVRGEAADARSDIYSFGVSLYEMLTGKLPFKGDSQYSLMTAHLNQIPPAPITLRGDLPPGLNEIIMMAIAKDPANRFQLADAFRAALSSVPVSDLPKAETTVTPTPKHPVPSGQTTVIDTPVTPRVATSPATPAPARAVAVGSGAAAAPALAKETVAPTPTPAPVPSNPPIAAPTAPGTQRTGSRGAWVAIGALLGAGALIAAGIYVPRHFKTQADPNKAIFQDKSSATSSGTTTTASATTPDTTAAPNSEPIVSLQSNQGGMKVDANGNVSIDSPQGSIHLDGTTGTVKMSDKKGAGLALTPPTPARKDLASGNRVPVASSRAKSETVPQTPATSSGPSPEEIAKIEDEADKLNIRGATASKSLDTLRQQQNAAGYNLRADVASAEERAQLYLAKGNDALKAQDYRKAQKYFDLADAEISKIEKFLGH